MKFNVFILLYIFYLFLILEVVHLVTVFKKNSIDFSNIKDKNLRSKYLTQKMLNRNFENYDDVYKQNYLSEKLANKKSNSIDSNFIEKNNDTIITNFISKNFTHYISNNYSEIFNDNFAFKSKIQFDNLDKHINTFQFKQTNKINSTNSSILIKNQKFYNLNYKNTTSGNRALAYSKQEVGSGNIDDTNQNTDNDQNTNINSMKGYEGFCLFKHNDHILNLNKIKSRDNNFYIKVYGEVYEFNICKNIRSYDDSRKGLFLNKINDILYAGDNNKEKFLVVNEGKYASSENQNSKYDNPFHIGNIIKTGLSSFNKYNYFINKKNNNPTKNVDKPNDAVIDAVYYNKRKKDFINNEMINDYKQTNNDMKNNVEENNFEPDAYVNNKPGDNVTNDNINNNSPTNEEIKIKLLDDEKNNKQTQDDGENKNNNNKSNNVNSIPKSSQNLFEPDEDPHYDFVTNVAEKPIFESLLLYLPQGQCCVTDPETGDDINYTIVYEIFCDENAKKPLILNESEFNPNSCFNKIKINTKYICPRYIIKYSPWYERLILDKGYIAFIIILVGIFLMFFGKLNMRFSMCLSICLLSYIFMGALNWIDGSQNAKNIVFILIVPIICMFYYGLPTYLFWIFSTIMALNFQDILFCITAKFVIEHKIMHHEEYKVLCCLIFVSVYLIIVLQSDYHSDYWQTAFVGAISFTRGIAIRYGGFPDRVFINMLIEFREFSQLDRSFSETSLNYILSIIILWIFGFTIQKYLLQSFKEEFLECNRARKDNNKKNNKNGKKKNTNKDNNSENEENFKIFNKDEEKPGLKEEKSQKQKDLKKSLRNKSFNNPNFTNKLLKSADDIKKSNLKKNDVIRVREDENEEIRNLENFDKIPNKFQNLILSPKSEKTVSVFNEKDLNPHDDKIFYSNDINNKYNAKKKGGSLEKINEQTFGEIKKETN